MEKLVIAGIILIAFVLFVLLPGAYVIAGALLRYGEGDGNSEGDNSLGGDWGGYEEAPF